jgi:hypothetical protein
VDTFASSAYVSSMFARVLTWLAMLAIAVVTTVSAAHAARMVGMQADHSIHLIEMTHAATHGHAACDGGQPCRSADAGMCEFVCAAPSVVLTVPAVETARAFGPAGHDLPPDASHVGRAPGLNERPPKRRLL